MDRRPDMDALAAAKRRQYVKQEKRKHRILVTLLAVTILAIWGVIIFALYKLWAPVALPPVTTEATAEAEAMEKAGEGIANQRKAIALGTKDSLEIIQETGVGNDEANQLFMFTQWSEMMTEFARTGKTSTVVLPSDFSQSASMFEQMLTASKVQNDSKE